MSNRRVLSRWRVPRRPLQERVLAASLILPVLCIAPVLAQTPASPPPQTQSVLQSLPNVAAPHITPPAPILPDPPPPATEPGELRGMWVVRDSLVSPQSVHLVVQTAVKYHLNALFVQVRGRGDAWYNSPFEPRAEALAHQPHEFDPLAQIVAEGHANGLQIHAWMNTFLTWSGYRAPYSPQHLWNAHRDWFACDRNGHCTPAPTNRSEGAYLQPSNPEVQQHLLNVYTYVATHYDVDGIHFDYCRYDGPEYDFSGSTLARFRGAMTANMPEDQIAQIDKRLGTDRLAYVHAFGDEWQTWRREQLSGVVAKISAAVKAAKPWLQVSAAVFPDASEAFHQRGQDWPGWLKAGYLDAVALMAYGYDTNRVLEQTRAAVAASGGRHVYTGIGAWHLPVQDVAHKIALLRQTGAAGINLFSYNGVHTRSRYLSTLARGVFASRSAPPRMRWLPGRTDAAKSGSADSASDSMDGQKVRDSQPK